MKRILSLCLLLCAGVYQCHAGIKLAPEMGFNVHYYKYKVTASNFRETSISEGTSLGLGYRLGAIMEVGITKHLNINTGLFFFTDPSAIKYGTYDNENFTSSYYTGVSDTLVMVQSKSVISKLEVPLYVNYKLGKPGDNLRAQVGIGGFIDYSLSNKYKNDYPTGVSAIYNYNNISFRYRANFGLGISGALVWKGGLYTKMAIQYVFPQNTSSVNLTDVKVTNMNMALTVGWFLLGNKK